MAIFPWDVHLLLLIQLSILEFNLSLSIRDSKSCFFPREMLHCLCKFSKQDSCKTMHTSYVSRNNMSTISNLMISIFEKKVMMKSGTYFTLDISNWYFFPVQTRKKIKLDISNWRMSKISKIPVQIDRRPGFFRVKLYCAKSCSMKKDMWQNRKILSSSIKVVLSTFEKCISFQI